MTERTVYGITADLADEFNSEQWVNLYQLDPVQGEAHLHYRGRYQVKNLPTILAGAPLEQFALEPVDAGGNVISVQQALNDTTEENG